MRGGPLKSGRINQGNHTTMNLPDALKNIEGAVEALADAISKAKADPNLPPIAQDLSSAGEDLLKALQDIL